LDAQRLAIGPQAVAAILRVTLLLEAHRLAVSGGELEAVGILPHHDAVGAYRDGSLREHDVTFENGHATRVVGTHLVGFDVGRLVAVRLLGEGRQDDRGEGGRQGGGEQTAARFLHHGSSALFIGSYRPRTRSRRYNSCESLWYSMPRPVSTRVPS